jgi:hypothetical protein
VPPVAGGTRVRPAAAAGDGGENPHSLLPRQERTRLFIGVREKPLHGASPVAVRNPCHANCRTASVKFVTDCACCHFAAAIRRTKKSLRESHAESPCFAPHGGSKKTAGAIVKHPTYPPIQLPICGSKMTAGAIVKRPGQPTTSSPRSFPRTEVRHMPNSRRNPGAGIPAKALAGKRPCFFSTVNGAFSFRERKWGVGSRPAPVGRNVSPPAPWGGVSPRPQAHIPPAPPAQGGQRIPRWGRRARRTSSLALPFRRKWDILK